MFYHDAPRIVAARFDRIGVALIHRRHILGLLAAAAIAPSRTFANVAPQRSEIRDDLAKRFTDAGTVGTFVGYKGGAQTVFALNLDVSEPRHVADRMKLAQQCLADIGAI